MKETIKAFLKIIGFSPKNTPVIIGEQQGDEFFKDRVKFYLGNLPYKVANNLSIKIFMSGCPIGYYGERNVFLKFRPYTFHLDSKNNPNDGGDWISFSNLCYQHKSNTGLAFEKFTYAVSNLKDRKHSKTYIFGTGPSLSMANQREWSDGYRIVCNTIVRDSELWHHINPDFVVAGDPIYHFGFTEFAEAFRSDLRRRLSERPTYFIYPAVFDVIVQRELSEFSSLLIPVPISNNSSKFEKDLLVRFKLPSLGNVLNLLLLPVAVTLTKKIYLWGFDGRAPQDSGFWANSSLHSYPEFMSSLHNAHPAFFEHHVPRGNEQKYVLSIHGDELDEDLIEMERRGWSFEMMHKSHTPTLAKRCKNHD